MMLWSFGQVRPTMLRLGMRTSSIFNSQHVAARHNKLAKRKQHVAPNNVAIGKVFIRAKWPIRPELIPVSLP